MVEHKEKQSARAGASSNRDYPPTTQGVGPNARRESTPSALVPSTYDSGTSRKENRHRIDSYRPGRDGPLRRRSPPLQEMNGTRSANVDEGIYGRCSGLHKRADNPTPFMRPTQASQKKQTKGNTRTPSEKPPAQDGVSKSITTPIAQPSTSNSVSVPKGIIPTPKSDPGLRKAVQPLQKLSRPANKKNLEPKVGVGKEPALLPSNSGNEVSTRTELDPVKASASPNPKPAQVNSADAKYAGKKLPSTPAQPAQPTQPARPQPATVKGPASLQSKADLEAKRQDLEDEIEILEVGIPNQKKAFRETGNSNVGRWLSIHEHRLPGLRKELDVCNQELAKLKKKDTIVHRQPPLKSNPKAVKPSGTPVASQPAARLRSTAKRGRSSEVATPGSRPKAQESTHSKAIRSAADQKKPGPKAHGTDDTVAAKTRKLQREVADLTNEAQNALETSKLGSRKKFIEEQQRRANELEEKIRAVEAKFENLKKLKAAESVKSRKRSRSVSDDEDESTDTTPRKKRTVVKPSSTVTKARVDAKDTKRLKSQIKTPYNPKPSPHKRKSGPSTDDNGSGEDETTDTAPRKKRAVAKPSSTVTKARADSKTTKSLKSNSRTPSYNPKPSPHKRKSGPSTDDDGSSDDEPVVISRPLKKLKPDWGRSKAKSDSGTAKAKSDSGTGNTKPDSGTGKCKSDPGIGKPKSESGTGKAKSNSGTGKAKSGPGTGKTKSQARNKPDPDTKADEAPRQRGVASRTQRKSKAPSRNDPEEAESSSSDDDWIVDDLSDEKNKNKKKNKRTIPSAARRFVKTW